MEPIKTHNLKNMKPSIAPLLCQLFLYVIQFLIIPIIKPTSSDDQFAHLFVLITTTGVVSFLGMFFLSDKFGYWFLGLNVYAILIFLCNPNKAYGMEEGGLSFGFVFAIFWFILAFLEQFVVWLIVKGLKWLRKKKQNTKV